MDEEEELHSWERRLLLGLVGLLIVAFTAWAGVVWNGTREVVYRMDSMIAAQAASALEQERYRAIIERRLTIQEQQIALLSQRQALVIEVLKQKEGAFIP